MIAKKEIQKLERTVNAYFPFWDDWRQQESCLLNDEDLYIIKIHIRNKFKINLFEVFMFYNQPKTIERIADKLILDHLNFKDWILSGFLIRIIELSKKNGNEAFLNTPIGLLNLDEPLKKPLSKLGIISLKELFIKFKEADFLKQKNFNLVLEFETINRFKKPLLLKPVTY